MSRTNTRKAIAWFCSCSLLVAACGGGSTSASGESDATGAEPAPTEVDLSAPSEPEPTVPAAPTGTRAVAPTGTGAVRDLLDAKYLATLTNENSPTNGVFMITVLDSNGTAVSASSGSDANGNTPTVSDVFRVGSITKVFTALAVLTLVDEGAIDLDAPASDYVTRVPVPGGVTVRDLLSHRSGIFNYTDLPEFFPSVFADPERVWKPEESVGLVADRERLFEPGSQYRYSNTNYIILGILIEEVTGQPYHRVVRMRIIDPLGLSSTYLAGHEDGAEPFDPFEGLLDDSDAEYDYTSIATAAWSAGAMVTNAEDLHALFTAIFHAQVVSQEMVSEMTDGTGYGLGVDLSHWRSGIVGHNGGIAGYSTFVRHSNQSGITAFAALTDERVDPTGALATVLGLLAGDSAESASEPAVNAADPPPNDRFENTIVVDPEALPFTVTVDTTGATTDVDDLKVACPAPATDASVWYSITPASNMRLLVSADGSDYSSGISAFTAAAELFSLIECRPFSFVVDAQAGVTYHVQVFDGQEDGQGNGGDLVFTIEEAP